MTTTTVPKIDKQFLQQFCSPPLNKDGMHEPFTIAPCTYATTGSIMVRVPRLDNVTAPCPESRPKLGDVQLTPQVPGLWSTLPDWEQPHLEQCIFCKGTGRVTLCEECKGDGVLLLDNESNQYEVECKSCCGAGSRPGGITPCAVCDIHGQVYVDADPTVKITGHSFHPSVLSLIAKLPNVKIFFPDAADNYSHPLTFDGGIGLAMGCRQ